MLTLDGRPLVIQPFEVTQLAWAGKWDQEPLLESIRNKEFGAIILYDRPWVHERWTEEMLEAITQSYTLVDIVAENKIYKAGARAVTSTVDACPGSTWRLPGDGSRGIQLRDDGIDLFGNAKEASTPVYAMADGVLTRRPEWVDGVAILHEDPLRPGEKVWALYGGMAAANGTDSFVSKDFPTGITDIPVKSGQLLGYQGTWSGTPQWPQWVHVFIVLVDAYGKSSQPKNITSADILDPAPYLGLVVESGKDYPQPLKCRQP
ncbi:MAG TPA: hypothetical protein VFY66_15655 [Anaerolineales bacterium]|nr:hypothetical protein [Anaerolineales bacterium]